MARAKTKADELYNQRRRVRRVIENIKKNLDSFTGVRREAVESYIADLRNLVERSLQKNRPAGLSKQEQTRYDERLTRSLMNVGQVSKTSRQERSNKIFQREINLASSGDEDTALGSIGLAKVKIFYKATENMYLGYPMEQRNQLIMQGLGVNSLAEAMEIVLSTQKEALQKAEEFYMKGATGPDGADGRKDPSPDYLAYVRKL